MSSDAFKNLCDENWLMKQLEYDEPCGIMACSPELYELMFKDGVQVRSIGEVLPQYFRSMKQKLIELSKTDYIELENNSVKEIEE